jgi:YesN/AraC family two-component response regulator
MLKMHDYHMLLTDLKMPGIDGLELISKAKNQDHNGCRLCNC